MWIRYSQDTYIPNWLKINLSESCLYCGSEMEHFYNGNRCTNRRCSNPDCCSYLAHRANFIAGLTNAKGVGPAKFLSNQQELSCRTPLELYVSVCGKPEADLHTFLRMCCIPGIDSEWEKICVGQDIHDLDELYEKYDGKWKEVLDKRKDEIYYNYNYVVLRKPNANVVRKAGKVFTIMITGTPNEFASKEDFINTINAAAAGYVKVIHQKTARQSGVDFLIREPGSTTRGKVTAAEKGGIPIVTSKDFINIVTYEIIRMKEGGME